MTSESPQLERGSFRDRESRVFYRNGGVFRTLSSNGAEEWERVAATHFFPRLMEAGKVVHTERVELETLGGSTPDGQGGHWVGALRHHRIPYVSYPYEWAFGMLQDAALLQLEVLAAALEEDMTLKDATPYNVQWEGSRPVFIDVPSFIRLEPGEPWAGYRQFCELYLYPLFLSAYKGAPFQPWLRGSIDGISATEFRGLLSKRDLLRPGVLLHVSLQAMMQTRYASSEKDVKKEMRDAGFHKELIQANVRKLTKLVRGLTWKRGRSTWSDYAEHNTYDAGGRESKATFVREATADRPRRIVWDLGANTGEYSRVAAEHADHVVAMDGDQLAIERLYQELKAEENAKILPLVMNLADASPNLGWRGAERKDLAQRGAPDLVLCLALIHHVVISANIPLAEFVDWLATLGSDVVIEWVSKADPMVKILLRNKEDQYHDYDQGALEDCLAEHFEIARRQDLNEGTRTLYYARRA